MRRAGALLALVVLLSNPVRGLAASIESASALFARGDFLAAAREGEALDTADGLALAARATLAHAEFQAAPDQRRRDVLAAESLARRALAKDGGHVEALIELSLAVGYVARKKGAVSAHFQGLVAEGRDYLVRALALQPDNAWANATLGAWHFEVVRHGGSMIASALYGASVRRGIDLFRRSLDLEPDNVVFRYEFALALLSLDPRDYAVQAEGQLAKAIAIPPKSALDRLMLGRSELLLSALRSDGGRGLEGEIRKIRDIRTLARPDGRRATPGK